MTTFYDILRPHLSQTMIEDNQNGFGYTEMLSLNMVTVCMTGTGLFLFVLCPFLFMADETMGLTLFVSAFVLLVLFSFVIPRIYRKKQDVCDQKTSLFVATIHNLYNEYIASDRISAILESQQIRASLAHNSPVAQKLYVLEKEADTPLPDFDCYLSVKAWLSTKAKYLELKEFMAAHQVG